MRFRNLKNKTKEKPKQKQTKFKLARISSRIKAFITDLFMIYAPILYIITYIFMDGKDDFQNSNLAPLIGVSLYAFIYTVLVSKFGQTPGKKAYEIKIVDSKSGELLNFWRSLCRFVMFLFSASIIIGLLIQIYRKDNRMLHDLICGSVVIEVKDN